jgi:peptide/nickel transport system permease protein
MVHSEPRPAAAPEGSRRWARLGRSLGFIRAILARPMGGVALGCVSLILLVACFAPFIAPYDPLDIDIFSRLQPPSFHHWMGTDQLGRDVFSRVIFGTRTAMTVAGGSLGLSTAFGLFLGLIAGYGPRWLDALFLLCFDSVMSLPVIIFALALVTLLGPSLTTLIVIIVAFTTPGYARVVRSQTLVLKKTEYVLAARAMGAGVPRILLRHVMPNLFGPLLVLVSMDVTTVITVESGLSFIGLGVQPPTPSWGSILNDGYSFIHMAWYLVLDGGLPIVVATIGFNFLGETIRDVLDPKLRGGR